MYCSAGKKHTCSNSRVIGILLSSLSKSRAPACKTYYNKFSMHTTMCSIILIRVAGFLYFHACLYEPPHKDDMIEDGGNVLVHSKAVLPAHMHYKESMFANSNSQNLLAFL